MEDFVTLVGDTHVYVSRVSRQYAFQDTRELYQKSHQSLRYLLQNVPSCTSVCHSFLYHLSFFVPIRTQSIVKLFTVYICLYESNVTRKIKINYIHGKPPLMKNLLYVSFNLALFTGPISL